MTQTTENQSTKTPQVIPNPIPDDKAKKTEIGSVFISNYPPFSFWNEDALGELDARLEKAPRRTTPMGLYLHVPFCRRRCKFCYFRVYTDKNADEIQTYLDSMAREVELWAERPAIAGRPLDFIYIGGGTPSYIAVKHLRAFQKRIDAALPWKHAREITFECEPGTLTESKIQALRELGITRLSLGIENFDDEILRENGRAHVTTEIDRCLPWIQEADFPQLNVDLIAGMVGETWEKWKTTVERTIEVDPESVTVYQMELPFNTRYSKSILDGEIETPVADWATKRAWHDYAIGRFVEAGYEVSSAYTVVKRGQKKDSKSAFLYRDSLWEGADLVAAGVASFGHVSGVHFQNHSGWKPYLDSLAEDRQPLGRAFVTSDHDRLTRETILQLKRGSLDTARLEKKFGVDVLGLFADAFEELRGRGMLEIHDQRVDLTREGLLQVDALLPAFYEEKYQGARYT